ncbi:MAG: spore germination protein [Clostridiales bacterium]|jgi:spore germination protein|nr:spore germination protein [Clostridiales bacterium]
MFSLNQKISVRQLQVLSILHVFGAGIIMLPRQAAAYGGQDAWIIVLLAACAALIFTYLMATVGRKFPADSFVSMTARLLSAPVGKCLAVLLALKLILSCGLALRLFSDILRQTMMRNTPCFVVCAAMGAVGAYTAAKGYETRARMAQILFPLILLPVLIVFCLAAFEADFSNLKPVFSTPPRDMFMGVFRSSAAFNGLELILLIHPYARRPDGVRKGLMQAMIFSGVLMALITGITIARLGAIDVTRQLWPVLEMMGLIDLPGSFIDRQDALVMSFWILSTFAVVNCELFFSALLFKDTVGKGKHAYYIIACLAAILVISFLPLSAERVNQIQTWLYSTLDVGFMAVLPILLLAAAKIRKIGGA